MKQTAIFLFFIFMWLVAVWANSSLFIEKYLISVKRIERVFKKLIGRGVTGFQNLCALFAYAWRKQRMVFVEVVIVLVVVEFGLVVVAITALYSATALSNQISL